MTKENKNLVMLEAEREIAKNRLQEQIIIIKRTLDNLEFKLKKDDKYLFSADGLMDNSIDIYLNQVVAYDRAIELLKIES
ncbi:hypothetical protein ASG46_06215 [Bacillus sp. Leaf49]|uniref:hypothetical protein n=1 Tax=Bacillus sp. Leaf49 TaxID=1736222 RepID=UPI0006F3AE02|nr:hypothetical protein [Bacillus sp. Leaf49]KQU12130.1 hypothetical protein ASG46_06215 [Bacillus sp. Leaf49]